MPAKSKSQQRFMGMVHSYQKSGGKASKAVKDAAKSMSDKDAEDYASTKHDALKEKLRNLIKQEIKSMNEGFEKYHLGGLLDSKLKKRLERAIKLWGGKIDSVGQDYIKFRLSSFEVTKLPMLLKKLDHKKNVWIGDKRK